jgi:hypothetical protein
MTRSTTSPPASRRTPIIIGGVVVILAVVAGLLLASVLGRPSGTASGDGSPTPVPSVAAPSDSPEPSQPAESPEPSGSPIDAPAPSDDPGPSPVVEAPDGVLPPGAYVRVIVDSLRVREGPTTDAAEVVTLPNGAVVLLGYSAYHPGFGPVEADGFTWYPVSIFDGNEPATPGTYPTDETARGWAAVDDGSGAFVELVAPRCSEGDPDLAFLESLSEWERLACYGDRPLTLEGVLGCGGCGGLFPGIFEPEWLASPMNYDLLSVDPSQHLGPFMTYWSPDGPARPDAGSIVRITGHFDDPAAEGCRVAPGDPEPTDIDPVVGELYCRSHFVVEGVEVIGVDEDLPFS